MCHQTKLAHNKGGLLELVKKFYYYVGQSESKVRHVLLLMLGQANDQKIHELKLHECFI